MGNVKKKCIAISAFFMVALSVNGHADGFSLTNGQDIGEETHPYVRYLSIDNSSMCTGTFIKKNLFLTAAHCVKGSSYLSVRVKDGHYVYPSRVEYNLDWITTDRNGVNEHDTALLWFSSDVSSAVMPICRNNASVGDKFVLVGYGCNDFTNLTQEQWQECTGNGRNKKRQGTNIIKTITDAGVITFTGSAFSSGDYPSDSPTNGTGTNSASGPGDSGGPLLIKNGNNLCLHADSSGGKIVNKNIKPPRIGTIVLDTRIEPTKIIYSIYTNLRGQSSRNFLINKVPALACDASLDYSICHRLISTEFSKFNQGGLLSNLGLNATDLSTKAYAGTISYEQSMSKIRGPLAAVMVSAIFPVIY